MGFVGFYCNNFRYVLICLKAVIKRHLAVFNYVQFIMLSLTLLLIKTNLKFKYDQTTAIGTKMPKALISIFSKSGFQ